MNRIDVLQQYLQCSPEDSFLKHALALEYVKLGKLDEAEKLFQEILQTNPDYVGTYYHLGKLMEQKNDMGSAKKIYQEGMLIAQKLQDNHTYQELQNAYEDITG